LSPIPATPCCGDCVTRNEPDAAVLAELMAKPQGLPLSAPPRKGSRSRNRSCRAEAGRRPGKRLPPREGLLPRSEQGVAWIGSLKAKTLGAGGEAAATLSERRSPDNEAEQSSHVAVTPGARRCDAARRAGARRNGFGSPVSSSRAAPPSRQPGGRGKPGADGHDREGPMSLASLAMKGNAERSKGRRRRATSPALAEIVSRAARLRFPAPRCSRPSPPV